MRILSEKTSKLVSLLWERISYEFCDATSIHGFKHFVGRDKLYLERVFWIVLPFASLYFCLDFVYSVYEKWERDPIIISLDKQPSSIYTIPFPAVTICPETKVKTSELNFTHAFSLLRTGFLNESKDGERIRKVLALLQLCEYNLYERYDHPLHHNDLSVMLKSMAIPPLEVFNSCIWKGKPINCLKLFKSSLTNMGYCYTFNSLANSDLLRAEELDPSINTFNSEINPSDWTLDLGYRNGAGTKAFPRRVITGGYYGGLEVSLLVNKSDKDYLCEDSFQGFKVQLHMPNEYTLLMNQFFRVPVDQQLLVTVAPSVVITDSKVKYYTPDMRHCYYTNERRLRFFRIYTRKNCEIECLTNHTLSLCGCVRFSMPRPPRAPICSLRDASCYQEALSKVLKLEAMITEGVDRNISEYCNCLPSCNNVVYDSQVSQADWEWQKRPWIDNSKRQHLTMDNVHQSKIVIYFREAQFMPLKRNEHIAFSDLVASCGGLLSLFTGVSILSLLELIYYCTLRPFSIWRRLKRDESTEDIEAKCECTEKVEPVIQ
ncbi:pickpocket protein 28-like [Toxorhynchites rutilus septentrionalis]|uniref:pickpocket protein 28-like n=1 Tax=Toxorhynchites rutilus septentrionalis TaxID=329112 RepID=UPI00247B1989|nr:pickpocket protein 28-like [Toxorhynchites rutilus septentrionalis]